MAFKLTYSDGQESEHGDDTYWEVDDGVLKLGRKKGEWSVLLSPSHWAVIELGASSSKDDSDDGDDGDGDGDDDDEKDSVKDSDSGDDKDSRDDSRDDTDSEDDDSDKKKDDKKDDDG
ncbi:hypothetical protein ACQI4F_09675 [Mycolicibacterium vaccae]|uniref:hypothetical protein n=1 Tax=Mycolicibacterium vaccae TaxID=1810 RepID=UPI003CE9FC74